jgi:fido (protein-threonine AMPylation protein)/DNA-binding transcriptional ArsR family regulator
MKGGKVLTELENYITQGEPEQKERGYLWHTAIGLQQVDGLKPSDYLIATANENINGDITLDEAVASIESYYKSHPGKMDDESRTEEADKVSARIAQILAEKTFSFSPPEYIAIHRRLFEGIYKFAGKIRDYNISKSEWALNGETVYYASAQSIRDTLDYDFSQEMAFQYKGLSMEETVEHIAKFVSGLWQIHAFGEGNTRTTAVFAIKYLRTFGFDVTNDTFAGNAWYFRNALVRANYNDVKLGIHATQEFLDRFFGNLLLNEDNILKNRDLLIVPTQAVTGTKKSVGVNAGRSKVNAGIRKHIESRPYITAKELSESLGVSSRTVERHLRELKENGVLRRVGSDKTGHWEIIKE